MTDVTWTVGPDPLIIANGKLGPYANLTRGETVTFEFYFRDNAGASINLRGAYGGSEGGAYGGSEGGFYGTGVSIQVDGVTSYESLREYTEYTNGIKTEMDIDGEPTFRERTPSRDPVDTHLVSIVPESGVEKHPSLWGVITGGDDPTRLVNANARLDIEVYILGDFADYDSIETVQNTLEV